MGLLNTFFLPRHALLFVLLKIRKKHVDVANGDITFRILLVYFRFAMFLEIKLKKN